MTAETTHIIEYATLGLAVGIGKVWDHVRSKPRDVHLRQLRDDVRDLKAYIVGPDGNNGLRSEIREIKDRVIGLEDRERDRLHGKYSRD